MLLVIFNLFLFLLAFFPVYLSWYYYWLTPVFCCSDPPPPVSASPLFPPTLWNISDLSRSYIFGVYFSYIFLQWSILDGKRGCICIRQSHVYSYYLSHFTTNNNDETPDPRASDEWEAAKKSLPTLSQLLRFRHHTTTLTIVKISCVGNGNRPVGGQNRLTVFWLLVLT